MSIKSKIWIDTPEQLDLLKQRGLIIDDDERALHYLQSLGYYRLSGYIYPFRQVQNGQRVSELIADTHFNTILQLYLFDKGLRVAREILDFGALSHLYGGLKYKDRQKIAQKYHTTADIFGKWLKSLNFIRNVVAHHGRLWNLNIVERSDFNKSFAHLGNRLENHKAFGYFYLMGHLLDIISPNSTWKSRVIRHIHDNFPNVKNNAISLADFGYIDDIGILWQAKHGI